MDTNRFAALTRCVTGGLSRRRTSLGLLVALGLANLNPADQAEAKKKRCPPCKKRKNGKCKKHKPEGTSCGDSKVCNAGACVPCGPIGSPCCGAACNPGGACDAGECLACGGLAQPCCGEICSAGLQCEDGVCLEI